MKFLSTGLLIASAAGMLLAAPLALAGGRVNWSVTIGSPVPDSAPQVVYVHPEPVYVRPAPVYYHAPPVRYIRPSPVYVQLPVYVQPPVGVQYGSPYRVERPRHRNGYSYPHREQHHWKHHHD